MPRDHGYRPPANANYWSSRRTIYVLAAGPFVKVGVATDVGKRIAGLRSGCPYPIRVVSLHPAPALIIHQVERRIHKALAASQAEGEWFGVSADVAEAAVREAIRQADCAMLNWRRARGRRAKSADEIQGEKQMRALGDRLKALDAPL